MLATDESKIEELRKIQATVEEISQLLAGRERGHQGAVLGDLVATFLAGHFVPGDRLATRIVREELLTMHIELVRQLVQAIDRSRQQDVVEEDENAV